MKKSLLLLSSVVLLLVCVPAAGQKKWKQKEKRFEPVVREDARGYAGRYVGVEESHWLDVRADAEGRLTATLYEEGHAVALRDLRLDGARLTATKVYEDGRAAPFAGLFADRVLNGVRAFGVMVDSPVKVDDGVIIERLFYLLR
ncbi:MAG TPA: hypothetical protein VIP46_07335 [Pyrinomonadaceae bacterium]